MSGYKTFNVGFKCANCWATFVEEVKSLYKSTALENSVTRLHTCAQLRTNPDRTQGIAYAYAISEKSK